MSTCAYVLGVLDDPGHRDWKHRIFGLSSTENSASRCQCFSHCCLSNNRVSYVSCPSVFGIFVFLTSVVTCAGLVSRREPSAESRKATFKWKRKFSDLFLFTHCAIGSKYNGRVLFLRYKSSSDPCTKTWCLTINSQAFPECYEPIAMLIAIYCS